MNAEIVVRQLERLGIEFDVDAEGLLLRPAELIPEDWKPVVRQHKVAILNLMARRRNVQNHQGACPPCLCDVYQVQLDSDCPSCHAPLCVFCGGCQRAARTWREAQAIAQGEDAPRSAEDLPW